jgi:hypothetical protein
MFTQQGDLSKDSRAGVERTTIRYNKEYHQDLIIIKMIGDGYWKFKIKQL